MKIAYLLDLFPVLSETFVLNEILTLKKLGCDIHIYASGKEQRDLVHKSAESLDVNYILELDEPKSNIIKYLLRKALTRPVSFIRAICFSYSYYKKYFKQHGFAYFKFLILRASIISSIQFEDKKIQHIHSHFGADACFMSVLIYFLTGIPYSFTTHAYDIYRTPKMLTEKHKYAKFAVTISNYNKKYLSECFGIEKSTIHIIRCGINLDDFKYDDKHYLKKQDLIFQICSVGRIVEKKGFEYLIKACDIFNKMYGGTFQCSIIGDGELFKKTTQMINDLGLSKNVKLLGRKTQDDVQKLLKKCDFFVLPCVQEENGNIDGIPVSLMEAMAMGIVVISSTLAGIPELVQGAGIMVEPEDEESLFKAMKKVYKMSNEEKSKIALTQRRKIEEEFNLTKETKKLMCLFEST